jgi:cytochrome P450
MANSKDGKTTLMHNDATFSDEILKLAQSLMPEAPTAKVKQLIAGIADKNIDRKLHEVGWKAYDAVVFASHQAVGRVQSNSTFGQVLGTAIDVTLRWQRFQVAAAGAFFSALWPSLGLPSAVEIESLRRDVRELRDELRDTLAEREAREDAASELHSVLRDSIAHSADQPNGNPAAKSEATQHSVWLGWPGATPTEVIDDVGN